MQPLSKKTTFLAKRHTRKQQLPALIQLGSLGAGWKAQLWPGPGDSLVHSKVEIPATSFLWDCYFMVHWLDSPCYRKVEINYDLGP